MLLLIALLGCTPEQADLTTPPPDGPYTAQMGARGVTPRIETQLTQVRRTEAVAPPPPSMPSGEAVYTDCGAGPWPRNRRDSVADAEGDGSLVKRPSIPAPRPKPKSTTRAPATAAAPAPQPTPAATPANKPADSARSSGGASSGPAGAVAADPAPPPPSMAPATETTTIVGGIVGAGGSPGAGADGSASVSAGATGSAGVGDIGGEAAGGRGNNQNGYYRDGGASKKEVVDTPTPDAAQPEEAQDRSRLSRSADEKAPAYKSGEGGKLDNLGYVEGTESKDRGPKLAGNREANDPARREAAVIAELEQITEEEEDEEANAWWDWGATVHLSNDDSMSLASAQRVLWSVMNKRRPALSELRPHELLNYFSFDTAPVPEGQMFSVLGAGEAHGDTLSVALAVQGAVPVRQPLDLTLVVDRSGSMAAEGRMAYTTRGLNQMVTQLQPGDRIDLVTFESRVCTPLTDFVVGRDDPELLAHSMKSLYPKGSTDLDGGLKEAYRVQKARSAAQTHGRNRRVMLITDAFLNSGAVDANVVSEIATAYDNDGIRLTGIGVGREFNDDVLNKLTEKGKGAYVYLGSEAVVDRVFGAGFDSLVRTIAHDVRFSLHLPPSLAMERFYGEEASTVAADIQPIHYYAGTSQVFLQDLRIRGGELVHTDPVKLRIAWRDAITGEPDALELHTTVGALVDGDVRNLHKAQALMSWADWAQSWAMGASPCEQPRNDWSQRQQAVADDAELSFLDGLVGGVCGVRRTPPAAVAYKVKLDSDVPISEVALSCGHKSWAKPMTSGSTVARFDQAWPGQCTLRLQGRVGLETQVAVPQTGGDVRCVVRSGRLSCT